VQRAIAELDAGMGATQLAVKAPAPPPPAPGAAPALAPPRPPRSESTVDLSDSAVETVKLKDEAGAAASDESIRIPRRRSILPWAALLLFGGIGTKLWLDARATAAPAASTPEPETPASSGQNAPATSASAPASAAGAPMKHTGPAADAGPVRDAADAGTQGQGGAPAGSPSATRRPVPVKVGPANVHRLRPKSGTSRQSGRGT